MTFPDPRSTPAFTLAYDLAREAKATSGRALLVGGCVRDAYLGITPKDLDVEVFGIRESQMDALLARVAGSNVLRVGRSFPVWKIWTDEMGEGQAIDVALPRREVKVGDGHTDFQVVLDPSMTFEDAASRRDFSCNAMGYDPLTGEMLDPFHGRLDLMNGFLRHVSDEHFGEDPLRVLRGMQFCARFELTAVDSTIAKCAHLSQDHLSTERIWGEWEKLILRSVRPSYGLVFLADVGWHKYYPELKSLIGVPQDTKHHPEGEVWQHSLHCLDAFARTRTGDDREDLIVGLAALLHDTGKVTTTRRKLGPFMLPWQIPLGRITAYGHEEAGEAPTRSFLGRMTNEQDLIEDVVALVVNHMVPTHLYNEAHRKIEETGQVKQMNRSIRRLAQKVRLDRLARLVLIDKSGRPPKPAVSPEAEWLLERAAALEVKSEKPKPILMGRHLIELGMKPGLAMGLVLATAMQAQLDGEFTDLDGALEWARKEISR